MPSIAKIGEINVFRFFIAFCNLCTAPDILFNGIVLNALQLF